MEWIRCNVCGNLKQEVEYYKSNGVIRKTCKECIKEKYTFDKNKKAQYDKKRYEKIKKEKTETRHVCMRCGEYLANVKNGELEWCFHCLEHYEKTYKQKIKVEVILPYYRRVENVWKKEKE